MKRSLTDQTISGSLDWLTQRAAPTAAAPLPPAIAGQLLQLRLRLWPAIPIAIATATRRFSIVCLGIWTVSYGIVVAVVMQMNAAGFGQLTFAHASPSAPLSLTCAKSHKNIKKEQKPTPHRSMLQELLWQPALAFEHDLCCCCRCRCFCCRVVVAVVTMSHCGMRQPGLLWL